MGSDDDNVNVTLCSLRPSSNVGTILNETQTRAFLITSPKPHLPSNHVLIRVDKFGFSTNNLTYEVLGEHPHFRYFDFYPAPDTRYGIIPVWGFGSIVRSTVTQENLKLREGERVYGYFAPTRYLMVPVEVEDGRLGRHSFYVSRPYLPGDASLDRRPYNQIIRCDNDPQYISIPESEDLTMIYRPLFWTAYWCEDWLYSGNYPSGLSGVVISSASAKTAFCLAYLMGKREQKEVRIVGLTSEKNAGFTKGLGLYDAVVEYGAMGEYFGERCTDERWLYVDIAGKEGLNREMEDCLGARLAKCVRLGVTNVSPRSPKTILKTDKEAEMFFMPEWLAIRRSQLTLEEITKRQNDRWAGFMGDCKKWIELERVYGAESVMLSYERVIKDGFAPTKGYVWSMWDKPVLSRM